MSRQTRRAVTEAIAAHVADEEGQDIGMVTAWSLAVQVERPDPLDPEDDLIARFGYLDGGVFTALGLTYDWLHGLLDGGLDQEEE